MAEHLTFVSLRRALSARAGVSEKVADDFLGALFAGIQDGLQKDGKVTLSGLGTFKLQDVPPRESMNVVTNERFTIAGYRKVVFTAGSQTQHATANTKQAARSQEPIDPIKKLGEQAEEIKDILSELNAMTPAEAVIPAAPETAPIAEPVVEPVVVEPVVEPVEEPIAEPEQNTKKPFNPWLTGLITISVFAMLLVIAYFVLRHQIVSWADSMRATIEQRVSTEAVSPAPTEVQAVIPEETEATQATETTAATETTPTPANPWLDDNQRTFTEFLPEETVGKDSRLAWIAKKRYGEKALWVFIYEANRDRLKAPDRVMPGMKLRVPKLPKELRNVNDPETKALLDRLSEKYRK